MNKLILVFCLYLGFLSHCLGQSSWKMIADKEGIQVFSKTIPNSKVKAVKVECELQATATQLVSLLIDLPFAPQWVSHTRSCELVRRVSASELYYYSEVALPWPLENRDFVAHVKVTQNPQTKVVAVNAPAVPGFVAEKKGIVRISHSIGQWQITPIRAGVIKVEYTLQVDPGGIVPAWLVNLLAAQGPLESFHNMKIHLPKYRHVSLPYIVE